MTTMQTGAPIGLADLLAHFERLRAAAAVEENDHHRKTFRNYILRSMLAVAGRCEDIVDLELVVETPRYEFFDIGLLIEGRLGLANYHREQVRAESAVTLSEDQRLAFSDWGLAVERVDHTFLPAGVAAKRGLIPSEQPGDFFIEHRRAGMAYSYDELGRLISLRAYPAASATFTRVDRGDFLDAAAVSAEFENTIAVAWQEFTRNPTPAHRIGAQR
ncbi:MAG: hypothetical protein AB7R90_14415 [Reyranellaceae bacterium]